MRKYTLKLKRRDLLKSLVVIPAGVAAGCDSARRVTPLLSAEDSFKKLIFAIGPRVAEEKETADNFSSRFLRLKHVRILKSLLGRFFDWKASQRPRKQGPRTFNDRSGRIMHEIVRWVEPEPGDWTPEQLEPPF